MSTHITLLLLANAIYFARCRCINTLQPPEVTVADSKHLLVNWTKSFEGCNSSEVQNANVHIGSAVFDVAFAEHGARIEVNPCLTHPKISVRLQTETTYLWSHHSHYNDYNVHPKIEDLYSGLLQKQVIDKTCVKKSGELFVPDIPDELVRCVLQFTKATRSSRTTKSTQFRFTIVNPQNEYETRDVETNFKIDEQC